MLWCRQVCDVKPKNWASSDPQTSCFALLPSFVKTGYFCHSQDSFCPTPLNSVFFSLSRHTLGADPSSANLSTSPWKIDYSLLQIPLSAINSSTVSFLLDKSSHGWDETWEVLKPSQWVEWPLEFMTTTDKTQKPQLEKHFFKFNHLNLVYFERSNG